MSNQYFTGTRVEIRLDPEITVSDADSMQIRYRKPNGDTGEWEAEEDAGEIVYTTSAADIDRAGTWKLQACAIYGEEEKLGAFCFITFDEPL